MSDVENQGQGQENLNSGSGEVDQNDNLPSNRGPELSVEEQIAKLKEERDLYKKNHSELEKLMGKKAQESGDAKRAEEEAKMQKEAEAAKEDFIKSILDKVLENDITISDDIKAKAQELGVPEDVIELRALKHEKEMQKLYEAVGGKDAYVEIMEFGKTNVQLTKEQLAVIGLKLIYVNEIKNNGGTQQRVEGSTFSRPQVSRYTSLKDPAIAADLAYIQKNPNDTVAYNSYRKKLANTK